MDFKADEKMNGGISMTTYTDKNFGNRALYGNLPEIDIVTKIAKCLGEQR